MENKKRRKRDLASRPLELLQTKQLGPSPDWNRGGAAASIPAEGRLAGGDGGVERLQELTTGRFDDGVEVGGGREMAGGGAELRAAAAACSGGGPAG